MFLELVTIYLHLIWYQSVRVCGPVFEFLLLLLFVDYYAYIGPYLENLWSINTQKYGM